MPEIPPIITVASEDELKGVKRKSDRGTIAKITFEILYPDGAKKIVSYDHTWISLLAGILFEETVMNDTEKGLFNISKEDWTKNPAFIKLGNDGSKAGSCCLRGGHGGQDCWGMVADSPRK